MAKTAYERNKNAIKKYLADKTDSIQIRVPKGKKEEYKAFATQKGTSLNALIYDLLDDECVCPLITHHTFQKDELTITIDIFDWSATNSVACRIKVVDKQAGLEFKSKAKILDDKSQVLNTDETLKVNNVEKYAIAEIKDNIQRISRSF